MKKRCSSSRGPSQDESEEEEQDLDQMKVPLPQKAVVKSPQSLSFSQYFKDIPDMSGETFSIILTRNGIAYNSKETGTFSSGIKFRYKETTLDCLNLEVTLGCFQTDISIFLINLPHDFCGAKNPFASGAFGQVTLIKF